MNDWGRTVERKAIGSYSVSIFTPRPTHVHHMVRHAARWGARTFVIFGERRISFDRFTRAVSAAAEHLRAAGVAARRPVMLLGANSPEWLLAFWALAECDAIAALGNGWWSASEIAEAVELTEATVIIADARRRALLDPDLAARCAVIALEELVACFDSTASPQTSPVGDEEDIALLVFTSGTTGRPKAAMISHRALLACLHNLYAYRGALPHELPTDGPQACLLLTGPLFHVGGTMLQTQCLLSGHKLVLVEGRSDPVAIIDLIERERVTSWSAVPTIVSRVVNHPEAQERDLSSMVGTAMGGSAVDPALAARFRQVFPSARLGTGATYGMTETSGSVTMVSGEAYLGKPTSAGIPLPNCEISIRERDEDGVGEILVRTPSAISGYWRNPDANIVDADGWTHTGDLGRLDADGHLHVVGRSKDVIIRGGENISAAAVEQVLESHPAVAEAAVVGLPHTDLGEELAAAIVLNAGHGCDSEALRAHVAARLGYFQVPTRWWLRTEQLPTNATGKVLKSELVLSWPASSHEGSPALHAIR